MALRPRGACHSAAFHRTELCKYFMQGECPNGRRCKFAHGLSALRPKPELRRTQWCKRFVFSGECVKGDDCSFAHFLEELRPLHEVLPACQEVAAFAYSEEADALSTSSTQDARSELALSSNESNSGASLDSGNSWDAQASGATLQPVKSQAGAAPGLFDEKIS
mmetsp:Transcript_80268/g.186404  ORF Transcript_80268/g.186404 Transcript_80268/m.186404 type:complete len:164 (-) Transcript_80268:123-614(-)|eukprot:CAMPEP_0171145560 /NCGR_PEP_ID=MMETSP0766_2-20121228/147126_1 /TAXON_ID=439317 /ORGANISM="Gambierdiscus australes, Strain CAWD 149" /LENGTH=163 /DNA_ID=CAMNT_0011609465 /DNA_START=53 /DNA_END=544 /DNA_ORIENTATION=+